MSPPPFVFCLFTKTQKAQEMTLDNSNSLLRVLSWNLRFQGFGKQIDGICNVIENDRADVLTFQEVSEKHSKDF